MIHSSNNSSLSWWSTSVVIIVSVISVGLSGRLVPEERANRIVAVSHLAILETGEIESRIDAALLAVQLERGSCGKY